MNENQIREEIEDLLFSLDINQDILTNEKIKYYVYCQYYRRKFYSLMDISNFRYLTGKLRMMFFSIDQLIYEADVEHMFWSNLTKLLNDPKMVYVYNDIASDIEDLLIYFSQNALYRLEFFDEYNKAFETYLNNGLLLNDSYFLSDLKKEVFIDKLNNYNKKLELIKPKK